MMTETTEAFKKTTEAHFKLFRQECEKWIKAFNLRNWEINYRHTKPPGDQKAWAALNHQGRQCDLCLSSGWREAFPITNIEIRKTAFHEVCELLLYPMYYLAESRFLSESEMEPACHDVIHALQNAVFKP